MTDALTDAPTRAPEAPGSGLQWMPDDEPAGGESGGTERGGPLRRWFDRGRERLAHMPAEGYVTLGIVLACVVFVFVQLGPADIFSDSTPAGGDMGAHVWGPAYLRDQLLPAGRLSGWAPDWYAGFPAFQFYMVLPSLLIALLSYVLPYGVAFKLVAISGLVTLPVAAWAFGRLTRLAFPIPALLAVGATMFLFDRSFSILGGNIASTLAGEFAFSISLSFALLYLGVVGRGLETGRYRAWAAVLLALTALCHLIPLIFALAASAIWFVLHLSWGRLRAAWAVPLALVSVAGGALLSTTDLWRNELEFADFPASIVRFCVLSASVAVVLFVIALFVVDFPTARLRWMLPVLVVGGALSAFWTVPFYLRHGYMNDMGWEKKFDNRNLLFERSRLDAQLVDSPPIAWLLVFAGIGAVAAVVYLVLARRRAGVFWVVVAVVAAVAFTLAPQGRLWNARLLPFYYLSLYMLAAIGVGYLVHALATAFARDPARPVRAVRGGGAIAAAAVGLLVLAVPLRALPSSVAGIQLADLDGTTYKWAFLPATTDNSFIDSWARWNFSGYEGKAAYPEYHDVVATMDRVGDEYGCGRAMWEHEEEHNRYGTPMALMLLPFWTDGCIGSMEGLYFEASSTTPYHFINQDELSSAPSNAQRDLPYVAGAPSQTEFDQGVQHLQMLGVRYYMAISERMIDLASRNADLVEIARSGPWVVYEVAGSELVTPLANEPAVAEGLANPAHAWLDRSMAWYMDPDAWSVHLAADGPDDWQRVGVGEQPEERAQPPVEVTGITTTEDSIEFDVSEVGTPVLVKASYFPNWKASGADGPWRITPNLMVVVPTTEHVELRYGWTGVDALGWGTTLLGVVGLVLLWRAGPVVMPAGAPPRRRRAPVAEVTADADGDGGETGPDVGPAVVATDDDERSHRVPAAEFDPAEVILAPTEPPPPPEGPPAGEPPAPR